MKRSSQDNLSKLARRFLGGQGGATASEYAAILAVMIIAVIVSALVVGKELKSGMGDMKSSLAVTTPWGEADTKSSDAVQRPTSQGRLSDSGNGGTAEKGNRHPAGMKRESEHRDVSHTGKG